MEEEREIRKSRMQPKSPSSNKKKRRPKPPIFVFGVSSELKQEVGCECAGAIASSEVDLLDTDRPVKESQRGGGVRLCRRANPSQRLGKGSFEPDVC